MIRHLDDNNQTYFEHIYDSWKYSFQSLKASLYFFIHGIVPCIFEHSGSDTIFKLSSVLDSKLSGGSDSDED